ncbi:MAG: hypothetical protein OXH61_06960 [Acidimicrobiaceae bacterium]|nr:hypothetical protein [Acidimicrobiaceae bacterium]
MSLVTAIATVSLAWFARRVPEGVTGLMKRLDDSEQARLESEEARRQVEGHRDTLLTRLTRPYLHGIAISQAQGQTGQNAELRIGEPLGGFAPSLEVTLPLGQLPQTIQITKEKCRELLTEIQRTERVDEAGTAVIRYANVMLVVPVNRPSDNESVPVLVLFPQPDAIGPQVAFGPLTSWQEFREAVQQVANHRLPSRGESLESRTHRSS